MVRKVPNCLRSLPFSFAPVTNGFLSSNAELLNRLKVETPKFVEGEPYDSLEFHAALEYFKANHPRVFYVSLGETDEWAHMGRYDEYLAAARRADDLCSDPLENGPVIVAISGQNHVDLLARSRDAAAASTLGVIMAGTWTGPKTSGWPCWVPTLRHWVNEPIFLTSAKTKSPPRSQRFPAKTTTQWYQKPANPLAMCWARGFEH